MSSPPKTIEAYDMASLIMRLTEAHGISVEQLAKKTGVSKSVYYSILCGATGSTQYVLLVTAKALGYTVEYRIRDWYSNETNSFSDATTLLAWLFQKRAEELGSFQQLAIRLGVSPQYIYRVLKDADNLTEKGPLKRKGNSQQLARVRHWVNMFGFVFLTVLHPTTDHAQNETDHNQPQDQTT